MTVLSRNVIISSKNLGNTRGDIIFLQIYSLLTHSAARYGKTVVSMKCKKPRSVPEI